MNPHTRYEIYLEKTPRCFSLIVIVLIAMCILGVIYLSVTAPDPIVPPAALRMPKVPEVPDVKAKVQQKVDQALQGERQ